MTDLILLLTWVIIIGFGMVAPFVWGLGYVWVDVFTPHHVSYSLLSSLPIAFIMAVGTVMAYVALDRKARPRIVFEHGLIIVLAIWITLTETWADFPAQAWQKWDPSFKVLVATAFLPFVFRSRIQIEAYVLTLALAASGHLLPWGMKTFITGGGYDQALGLLGVNASPLSESSTVAAVLVMFVPLLLWIRTYSIILPRVAVVQFGIIAMVVMYLVGTIGTFARTGLVGIGILGTVLFLRSRRKFIYLVSVAFVAGILFTVTSDRWTTRMETLSNVQEEGSAYTRILIWKWTWDYALQHPLGGGFESYLGNVIVMPSGPDGQISVQRGRAFHNVYFAVLGQHGFPGLVFYLSIMGLTVFRLQRIAKRLKGRAELVWARELARATQLALLIIMACGNFIDISFIFIIWDIVAISLCLNNYVTHALKEAPPAAVQLVGKSARTKLQLANV